MGEVEKTFKMGRNKKNETVKLWKFSLKMS